ncbi:MAG TPA: helix-turn-helix domain-containing GNAT family N-acetyltransferase [Stellaceae bacterium]|jgi:DNA-binding MarR family transcriptional regulator/N-acetylglutamate synthase-like GNAT family acetyltransferase|nr:helix-turn-helix domain-containing GNAT family N-acetyltransferase [Stellaceae bacterium]
MVSPGFEERVAAVRRFNRFYTRRIGVLQEGLLDSEFSLAEARVLYELAHRQSLIARELERDLRLDPGYLSRILRGFQRRGLIERTASSTDRRRRQLQLTAAGRAAFAPLDAASRAEIGALLKTLPEPAQCRAVASMQAIERLLDTASRPREVVLRQHLPGDIGWVTARHGAIYAEEYGFDESFEALVAEIAAAFIKTYDPARERCWIAERDGVPLGSVFLVRHSEEIGKLRLLLVDPSARGLGIGRRLVAECVEFARVAGYRTLELWTQSILLAARNIYAATGFRLVKKEPHRSFGQALVGEHWELSL